MAIQLTVDDAKCVSEKFPRLSTDIDGQIVTGKLGFRCWFDEEKKELVHDPTNKNTISDTYEIKIDFKEKDTWGCPKVYETGSKIKKFAGRQKIELEDLHINFTGDCCLGIFAKHEWNGLLEFIQHEVVSFFYWQSHVRIHGEEPWKGYSHGNLGIKEAMTLNSKESTKGRNRNIDCPCGSGKKYKNCCRSRDASLEHQLLKKM